MWQKCFTKTYNWYNESGCRKIYIDDEDISNVDEARLAEIRKHFGMVFQGAALFDCLLLVKM